MGKLTNHNSNNKGKSHVNGGANQPSVATEGQIKPYFTQLPQSILEPDPDYVRRASQVLSDTFLIDCIAEDVQDFLEQVGPRKNIVSELQNLRYLIKTHPESQGRSLEYRAAMNFLRPLELLLSQMDGNWVMVLKDYYEQHNVPCAIEGYITNTPQED